MTASPELEALLALGRRAAALVRAVYATPFEVELKGPNDPVTRADREANALLCAELAARFPAAGIVAEESVPADRRLLEEAVARDRVFFVDPLDGTREFADRRDGEFAVMIGMTDLGRPRLGVVVIPSTGDALAGEVGRAAFVEHEDGRRVPLAVSTEREPARARLMVSRSHRPKVVEPLRAALGITRTIPCGSVGVKVARLCTADADLYVHGGRGAKRWDTCAPEAILVAAGGRFTDLDGALIDYTTAELALPNGLVASNGLLHDAAVAAARAAPAGYARGRRCALGARGC